MTRSHSPPRKRQRLSSPTYDEQLELPSQEEFRALDELEFSMSQSQSLYRPGFVSAFNPGESSQDVLGARSSQPPVDTFKRPTLSLFSSASKLPRDQEMEPDDSDNPFVSTSKEFTGFMPAALAPHPVDTTETHSSSPDPDPGEDGRDSAALVAVGAVSAPLMGFVSANIVRNVIAEKEDGHVPPSGSQESTGYANAGDEPELYGSSGQVTKEDAMAMFVASEKENHFQISAAALKAARERVERWAVEDGFPEYEEEAQEELPINTPLPSRQALVAVENVPTHATGVSQTARGLDDAGQPKSGFASTQEPSRAVGFLSASRVPKEPLSSEPRSQPPRLPQNTSFEIPSTSDLKGKTPVRPFKSPLVNRAAAHTSYNPPSTPSLPAPNNKSVVSISTPAKGLRPPFPKSATTAFTTPVRGAAFSTPGPSRSARKGPKKFVTPFKPGMRPGEPGRSQLQARYDADRRVVTSGNGASGSQPIIISSKKPTRRRFFNLTIPRGRQTLASSGLWPGKYSLGALASMGINTAELQDASLSRAPRCKLDASAQDVPGANHRSPDLRGPADALRELEAMGCSLATQDWVDNHWSLILWKIAGMVALDPDSEADVGRRRWSWTEIMRQLRYRYERELNGAARPALRLITTQDTSAALHMVLCVSGITWSEGGINEDGTPVVQHPTLELTDGWYRLRARVDEVLARAARRGVIRVGRKIAIAGATIPRDAEACEVLEAYDRVELNISGNGTHPAPWHAKLGFQPHPAIATLHSISPEGGVVPCLDLIVVKQHPVAFVEFSTNEDGRSVPGHPRLEKEEEEARAAWERKREKEFERIKEEANKKRRQYLDWALRFEAKAGSWNPGEDDEMPDHIESLFDDCEYSSDTGPTLRRVNRAEAGWLTRYARQRAEEELESLEADIDRELQSVCPPREVRNFRVLLMRDARVTAWDVLSLAFDGSRPGDLKEGQRFQVSDTCHADTHLLALRKDILL
ncbi:hypothetical protein BC834DRAFT_851763 [Gloeopeniophorella convolvens]|nr:hypothetical protein BC834DRAFT_851763 [Gloeopeniophorella convolvens]